MNLSQSIPLYSLKNARELGGYHTTDGKRIKSGVLLRTAKLDGISDEDLRALRDDYHLEHLIDFRMPMEIEKAADPEVQGAKYHHFDVLDMSEWVPPDAPVVDINSLDVIGVAQLMLHSGMLNDNMYVGFLMPEYGRKAFSGFFRVLLSAEPDRAVLWHCTSGKDRTGLAAMLLLSALGVDEEVIIKDFLLTNEHNARQIGDTMRYLKSKGCDDDFAHKALLVFDAVDESLMRTVIAHLKKEFGSVTGYIRDGLNISTEEINSLKEKYLLSN